MIRNLAKLVCLIVGGAAGWFVLLGVAELSKGWLPPVTGVIVMAIVFSALYFPLARPIAEVISDRLTVVAHRGRHIRSGTGLDFIPDAPKPLTCSMCGGPGGPICNDCNQQMARSSRTSLH